MFRVGPSVVCAVQTVSPRPRPDRHFRTHKREPVIQPFLTSACASFPSTNFIFSHSLARKTVAPALVSHFDTVDTREPYTTVY